MNEIGLDCCVGGLLLIGKQKWELRFLGKIYLFEHEYKFCFKGKNKDTINLIQKEIKMQ